MKKIIENKKAKKVFPKETIWTCDFCGGPDSWRTFSLEMSWGYGSQKFDCDSLKINCCHKPECQKFGENLRKNILKKFKTYTLENYFEI